MKKCHKIRYKNKTEAEIDVIRVTNKFGHNAGRQVSYKCPQCHGYHLTQRESRMR